MSFIVIKQLIDVVHLKVYSALDYHVNHSWLILALANSQDTHVDDCDCG